MATPFGKRPLIPDIEKLSYFRDCKYDILSQGRFSFTLHPKSVLSDLVNCQLFPNENIAFLFVLYADKDVQNMLAVKQVTEFEYDFRVSEEGTATLSSRLEPHITRSVTYRSGRCSLVALPSDEKQKESLKQELLKSAEWSSVDSCKVLVNWNKMASPGIPDIDNHVIIQVESKTSFSYDTLVVPKCKDLFTERMQMLQNNSERKLDAIFKKAYDTAKESEFDCNVMFDVLFCWLPAALSKVSSSSLDNSVDKPVDAKQLSNIDENESNPTFEAEMDLSQKEQRETKQCSLPTADFASGTEEHRSQHQTDESKDVQKENVSKQDESVSKNNAHDEHEDDHPLSLPEVSHQLSDNDSQNASNDESTTQPANIASDSETKNTNQDSTDELDEKKQNNPVAVTLKTETTSEDAKNMNLDQCTSENISTDDAIQQNCAENHNLNDSETTNEDQCQPNGISNQFSNDLDKRQNTDLNAAENQKDAHSETDQTQNAGNATMLHDDKTVDKPRDESEAQESNKKKAESENAVEKHDNLLSNSKNIFDTGNNHDQFSKPPEIASGDSENLKNETETCDQLFSANLNELPKNQHDSEIVTEDQCQPTDNSIQLSNHLDNLQITNLNTVENQKDAHFGTDQAENAGKLCNSQSKADASEQNFKEMVNLQNIGTLSTGSNHYQTAIVSPEPAVLSVEEEAHEIPAKKEVHIHPSLALFETPLEPNTRNILLVGPSGAGKSTLINSMVNYFKYETLTDADGQELFSVLPCKFSVQDDDYEFHTVALGEDKNECFNDLGQSVTQLPQVHKLQHGDLTLNLIDTPGLRDSRGVDQDDINLEAIEEAIRRAGTLHAICFVLLPNESKMGAGLEFVFRKLLSLFTVDAFPNVCFFFTNCCGTFFRPGDSIQPIRSLQAVVKAELHADLPFGKENVFCVDSDAFRYLVVKQKAPNLVYGKFEDFEFNWKKSSDAVARFSSYVQKLKPYEFKKVSLLQNVTPKTTYTRNIVHKIAGNIVSKITNNLLQGNTSKTQPTVQKGNAAANEISKNKRVPGESKHVATKPAKHNNMQNNTAKKNPKYYKPKPEDSWKQLNS